MRKNTRTSRTQKRKTIDKRRAPEIDTWKDASTKGKMKKIEEKKRKRKITKKERQIIRVTEIEDRDKETKKKKWQTKNWQIKEPTNNGRKKKRKSWNSAAGKYLGRWEVGGGMVWKWMKIVRFEKFPQIFKSLSFGFLSPLRPDFRFIPSTSSTSSSGSFNRKRHYSLSISRVIFKT